MNSNLHSTIPNLLKSRLPTLSLDNLNLYIDILVNNKATIATRAFITIVSLYIGYVLYRWYRLSHIPGPFWAGFTRYWSIRELIKGRQPAVYKALDDKYGSLVRVGPNELVTSDPALLKRMMAARSPYVRGPWYNAVRMDPARDNLISMRDDVAHTEMRNKMIAGYSGKENESLEASINHAVDLLILLIEKKYISSQSSYRPMDFGEKSEYFTLDAIGLLAFGELFGYLEHDEDVLDYFKIVRTFMPIMVVLAQIPLAARFLQSRFVRPFLPKQSDKLGFGAIIGIAKRVVTERFDPNAPPKRDMLASFIRHGLSRPQAEGEALLQIGAGSETTATSMRFVMLNILCNPHAYHKLQAEIDNGILTGRISSPITHSEAQNLPYLQAVIKEGLRIMPPAAAPFFKMVPKGGDVINGEFVVPEGTQIGVNVFGLQHNEGIFGDDAAIFRPERWIEAAAPGADKDRLGAMLNAVELNFSSGKYMCLGKPVAMMEMNKVFVELLRRYDWSIVNATNPAQVSHAGIWIVHDFIVRVSRREI